MNENIYNELNRYLNRTECKQLSNHHKNMLRRYVRIYQHDMPVGRILAKGFMKLNARYSNYQLVPQDFINWLYSY